MLLDQTSTGALLFVGITIATFISEDGATAVAAALARQKPVLLPLAFLAAFLGIWIGDIGLYAIARFGGRGALNSRLLKRFAQQNALHRAEDWFVHYGSASIVASRFVPGTRLPTYLAAGLLQVPLRRFASITGICAAIWVILVFILTGWFRVSPGVRVGYVLPVIVTVASAVALQRLVPRIVNQSISLWKRLSAWEFWPAWIFYPPVAMMCFWLGLKYRGFSLPAAANPGQKNGGIVGESKAEILAALRRTAPEFTAETHLISPGSLVTRMKRFESLLEERNWKYPVVLKPNVGQRGAGFRLVTQRGEAARYLATVTAPVVLQRYIPAEKEAGIFYYRLPGEERGEIFSITEKAFPEVEGTGEHTFEELVRRDPRASRIARVYVQRFPYLKDQVLPAGDKVRLVEAGNHCQGAIFRDGSNLHSEALRARIDEISKSVPGFYIGRYDVRYSSDDDLRAGNNFTILELNGASSEATSIYDARNSLLSAYKTLYRQWELVYAIGARNRAGGARSVSPLAVLKDWLHYRRTAASYPAAD